MADLGLEVIQGMGNGEIVDEPDQAVDLREIARCRRTRYDLKEKEDRKGEIEGSIQAR